MYQKTRELLSFIIKNLNYMDFDLRQEFYDILTYYKDKVIFNKFENNFKA